MASLLSLSSDLLMRVAHWLELDELCVFDTAISEQLLRVKYLSGLRNDTFLYAGTMPSPTWEYTSAWQQDYAQWLTMRRVFVNSLYLNEQTNPAVMILSNTMNRVNPGLISLSIDGDIDFSKVYIHTYIHNIYIHTYIHTYLPTYL
jgi:hypothetical protein